MVSVLDRSANPVGRKWLGKVARILIVDQDENLAAAVSNWLQIDGHVVEAVGDSNSALALMMKLPYDILILNLLLNGINGMELCRQYRQEGGLARVLMLTSGDAHVAKEDVFDSGADDYVTKPFNPREISARIRALMRRSIMIASDQLSAGDLIIDTGSRKVTKAGEEIKLLPQEFALLEFLMRDPNIIFSADVLRQRVWKAQASLETVRTHIKTLRRKIVRKNSSPKIETIHGRGYCLRC